MGSGSQGGQTDLRKPEFFKREGRDIATSTPGNANDLLRIGNSAVLRPGQSQGELARNYGMSGQNLRDTMITGVSPFSKDTLASFEGARNFGGPNFGGTLDSLKQDIGAMRGFKVDPGVNSTAEALRNFQSSGNTTRALGGLENFTGSQGAKDQLAKMNEFIRAGGDPSQAEAFLTESASGQFLDRNNPYLEDMIRAQQSSIKENFGGIAAQVGSQFAGSGSFNNSMRGSALTEQADLANRRLGEIEATQRGNQYQFERGNMENARAALGQFETQNRGIDLQGNQAALQGAMGLSQQELDAQTSAAQGFLGADAQRLSGMQAGGQLFLGGSQLTQEALAAALAGSASLGQIGTNQAIATNQAEAQRIAMLNAMGGQQEGALERVANRGMDLRNMRKDDLSFFSDLMHPGGTRISGANPNRFATATGSAMAGAGTGMAIGGPWGAAAGGAIGFATPYLMNA